MHFGLSAATCDINRRIHCALCAADLDDENQELRQTLSSLLQESRHKDSVNQALITEVSELGLKQERAQSGGYPTPCVCNSPWP